MFNTRLPILAGATTVLLLALIGGLAIAAPGSAPGEPTDGVPAPAAGAGVPNADPLTESGRWEWTGGGELNDIFFVDSSYGWAIGPGVWRTTDGGATWRHIALWDGTVLERVVFADRNHGWGQSADSRVFRTEDGGETWVFATYPHFGATHDFVGRPALATAVASHVWAAGNWEHCGYDGCDFGGLVSHSTDGGVNWGETPVFGYGNVADLEFVDPSKGWAVGSWEECEISAAATADGGASWARTCILDASPWTTAEGIAFGSTTHGWTIGTEWVNDVAVGRVWRSTDGGAAWQQQATFAEPLTWIQAQDASRAWIGMGTTVLRTTDGGAKWQPLAGSGPTRAMFKTDTLGWGIAGGSVFKTTNGGATWQTVLTLPPGYVPWYWDTFTGWRADGAGIVRTTDGGATWQTANTGLQAVDAFQFVDARNGWAWHNASLGLTHTTDGGATWRSQTTGTETLSGLQFVDRLTGWVRGGAGDLRRTTDGGLNWQQIVADGIGTGIQFVDRNHGWTTGTACQTYGDGYPGSICSTWQTRSTNGGISWSDSGRPGIAVFYLDANHGWGIGSFEDNDYRVGQLIAWDYSLERIIDGGVSWTRLWGISGQCGAYECPPLPSWRPSDVDDMFAADPERVWTWGTNPVAGSPVAASTDGGATWITQRAEARHLSGVRFDPTGSAYASGNGALRFRNTEISVYRAVHPPQIDGNLADWAGAPMYVLNADRAYRVLWTTPTPLDASATLQAAWDAGHLYFAIRVYDDAIKVDSGAQPWLDDAIEIGLDGRHDHVRNWSLDDDRQFTVTALGQIYESGKLLSDVPVARVGTSNGYILEFAIPKARLGELGLAARALPGPNWTLIDDDDGGNAEAKLEWTGTETNAANASWGQMRLSALEVVFSAAGTETPTATATSSRTPTATATTTPTATASAQPSTGTPTQTPIASATATPTASRTPTETATLTTTPTDTATATVTATQPPPLRRIYLPVLLRR